MEKIMTTFLQLHLLTSYPPACLNRDDLNRPKSAKMGGVDRLRISSQSLKRAWRTSDVFSEQLTGEIGIRSKELGRRIKEALLTGTPLGVLLQENLPTAEADGLISEKDANEWAWTIAFEFVKGKESNLSKDSLKSEQVVFYSRDELDEMERLVIALRKTGTQTPTPEQLEAIKKKGAPRTVDLAMFGRMLASSPDFNVEAACQVAHAVTVHRAAVEDDYFSAVDDLNRREENVGFAFGGEQGFGAGLFYQYVCIDCDRLRENLGGDAALAGRAIQALIEAAATVAPTGKQNSFASRAWAYYALAEKGSRQPRALSLAFMKPVREGDMLNEAVSALTSMRDNLDKVYYKGAALDSRSINATTGVGDFEALKSWAADCGGGA
jgi:CRISPR system Cascade subunit CasC